MKLFRQWKSMRTYLPFHTALSVFVDDYLFADHWWDERLPHSKPWKAKVFDLAGEAAEWIQHNWPWCSHYIVNDQCGIPEHRYCVHCMRPFPNGDLA